MITLYNDGLDLLAKIVSDKSCKEYASFPEVFTDYLPDKTPDYLPCDYRLVIFMPQNYYQKSIISKKTIYVRITLFLGTFHHFGSHPSMKNTLN